MTSDSVELHYLEAGSGPTLVFVPGWTMPAWIWKPQLEHFSTDHRVVALDPRGQGRIENLQENRAEWPRSFVKAIHRRPQPKEYLEALTEAALSTPTNAAALMIANVYFTGPRDLRPALESLDRPVLFVFSSLDWAVDAAQEVREGWPEVPVEVIDETSHALFRDKPEEFNRVLEEFLATLGPR